MKKIIRFSAIFLSATALILFFSSGISGFGGKDILDQYYFESLKKYPELKTELGNLSNTRREVLNFRSRYNMTRSEGTRYYNEANNLLAQIRDPELKKLAENKIKTSQAEFNRRLVYFERLTLPFDGLMRLDDDLCTTVRIIYSLKEQDYINTTINTDSVEVFNLKTAYQNQIEKVKGYVK